MGYRGSASDYFNELTSRDSIEAALQSEQLSGYAEMADLEEQVAQIDARFRVLLRPDAFPRMAVEDWWTRGIVRFAGPKLVRELKQTYRVTIAEI
ncbi:hypothetical protein HPO96_35980 [Kribbella sandramycini]|uniref:Uncharacterized protein n=1 Tax=Kribbella sandramycini TaxID=60450 RepID=A0A7Y4L952_9ACTN|nr:hypothetical protein [Kribbella sandramycini]